MWEVKNDMWIALAFWFNLFSCKPYYQKKKKKINYQNEKYISLFCLWEKSTLVKRVVYVCLYPVSLLHMSIPRYRLIIE